MAARLPHLDRGQAPADAHPIHDQVAKLAYVRASQLHHLTNRFDEALGTDPEAGVSPTGSGLP